MASLVLAASVAAGPARAGEPVAGPIGFLCGFGTYGDHAEIDGGPLVLVDDDGTVRNGTLTCRLRIGTVEYAPSATGTGVVVLAPVVVPWSGASSASLCTEFRYLGGPTLYYHSSDPTQDGHWTTDPNVACVEYVSADGGDILDPLDDVWPDDWIGCAVLALVFPPQGDVPGVWDCPPYGA